MIYRATLTAFTLATYLAQLRVDGSTPQRLENVPVALHIPPGQLTAGRKVLLDTGDHGDPADALVTAVLLESGGTIAADPWPAYVPDSIVTAKGDLIGATGNAAPARVPVGADYQVLQSLAVPALGLGWVDGLQVLARSSVTVSAGPNNTVETTFLTVDVPANGLASGRMLRASVYGDLLNNSGANQTFVLKMTFGGTIYYNDTSAAIATNAARRPLVIEAWLSRLNDASGSQALAGRLIIGNVAAATTGRGDLATGPLQDAVYAGDPVQDSTVLKTFAITLQCSAANANFDIRRLHAHAELL